MTDMKSSVSQPIIPAASCSERAPRSPQRMISIEGVLERRSQTFENWLVVFLIQVVKDEPKLMTNNRVIH